MYLICNFPLAQNRGVSNLSPVPATQLDYGSSAMLSLWFIKYLYLSNLLSECSFISWIRVIIAFSSKSSVRDSISRITKGIFMMWCTGDTKRSVNWSFLHRGSFWHHWNYKEMVNVKKMSNSLIDGQTNRPSSSP